MIGRRRQGLTYREPQIAQISQKGDGGNRDFAEWVWGRNVAAKTMGHRSSRGSSI